MQNELNEYLKEKGVSNDIRNKRMLATALGLIFDASTPEQESALLLALKVGGMAKVDNVKETFNLEYAFDVEPPIEYTTYEAALNRRNSEDKRSRLTRIIKTTTITQIL